jgi:hypothetical protein
MTAPVGLRIGWEFLNPFQYAVLFVDSCGSRRRIEEEIPHHRPAARHDHALYITVLGCAQRFRHDPLRRDATPCWNTPHFVGLVSSICHGLTRAFCIASSSYSQQLSQVFAQISTHRNFILATPYRLSLDPRRPPKPRWPTSDSYADEMLALRNKDRHPFACAKWECEHAHHCFGQCPPSPEDTLPPRPSSFRANTCSHATTQLEHLYLRQTCVGKKHLALAQIDGASNGRLLNVAYIGHVNWRAVPRSLNAACLYADQTFDALRQD